VKYFKNKFSQADFIPNRGKKNKCREAAVVSLGKPAALQCRTREATNQMGTGPQGSYTQQQKGIR